jgi:hypothetical protein
VHSAGGRIYCQIWHCGRVAHPDMRGGELPVGPSPIPATGDQPVQPYPIILKRRLQFVATRNATFLLAAISIDCPCRRIAARTGSGGTVR